jgi:chromosome partitioning protein
LTKTILVANQKGGVGKTSICFHLSGALAEMKKKVLLIDLDQQGNLSSCFMKNIYSVKTTISDLLLDDDIDVEDVIYDTSFEKIKIVPANLDFSRIDIQLAGEPDGQYLLLDKINDVKDDYDFIIIDAPPSLGLATRNGLVSADGVIIPIECQEWAARGSSHLKAAMEKIKIRANPSLSVMGYLVSKFDGRRKLETIYLEKLKEAFGNTVFKSVIKNSIRYPEAANVRKPITHYMPKSAQADAFRKLAREVKRR